MPSGVPVACVAINGARNAAILATQILGTSMPRFVEAPPLSAREAFALLTLFIGNVTANALWMNPLADGLFISELVWDEISGGDAEAAVRRQDAVKERIANSGRSIDNVERRLEIMNFFFHLS